MARHGKKHKRKRSARAVNGGSWEARYDAQWERRRREVEQAYERRRIEHLAMLVREIHAFLKEVGVAARVHDGSLLVDGTPFRLLSGEHSKPDAGPILDRLVATRLLDRLEQAVVAEVGGFKLALTPHRVQHGVRLVDEGGDAAMIWGTHALVGDDPLPVRGNFLRTGGAHWEALRTRLWRRSVGEVLLKLPASASDTAREEANDASRRIRAERYRDYHEPVLLNEQGGESTIRLDPVPDRDPVQVPFEFTRGGSFLRGAIRLKAPKDPLALAVFDRSTDESVITAAWLFALLAYRDLTCHVTSEDQGEFGEGRDEAALEDQPGSDRADRGGPSRTRAHADGVGRLAPARRAAVKHGRPVAELHLPASLNPTESTRKALSCYVAGHRRQLPPGQTHRPAAQLRAKLLGIALGQNETWVHPYWRGLEGRSPLVFDWEVPFRFDADGRLI